MRVTPYVPIDQPKIAIVGEAPGEQEELQGKPFVGPSGQELARMLQDAGINRHECYLTNVFWIRPPGNKIEGFCGTKADVGKDYPYPMLAPGKYFKPEVLEDIDIGEGYTTPNGNTKPTVLDRLRFELMDARPNLVIALGNTACWALLGQTKITKLRGTVHESTLVPGLKVLPTFHPAAVLRQWTYRAIAVVDLIKAKREAETKEIKRPVREIWINPTLDDIAAFWGKHVLGAELLSIDIETKHGMITCIGFSPSEKISLVIPFVDQDKPGYNYWHSALLEEAAWEWVSTFLESDIPKVGQNGLYDLQYLWRMGLAVNNYQHDTMLAHHALQPELPKSLGFLASVYTNESSWKHLRPRGHLSNKLEE